MEYWQVVAKIKKTGPKNQKNSAQISFFFSFNLWPFYPTKIGVKIGSVDAFQKYSFVMLTFESTNQNSTHEITYE